MLAGRLSWASTDSLHLKRHSQVIGFHFCLHSFFPFLASHFTGGFIPAFARCCLPVLRSLGEGGCMAANLLVFTSPTVFPPSAAYYTKTAAESAAEAIAILIVLPECLPWWARGGRLSSTVWPFEYRHQACHNNSEIDRGTLHRQWPLSCASCRGTSAQRL